MRRVGAKDRGHSCAEISRRVLAVDVLRCGNYGTRRQVIALVTEAEPIQRILTHRTPARLHRAAQPPPIAPARPVPELVVPL